jgi:DeoR family fructose operon transcriptional repressor
MPSSERHQALLELLERERRLTSEALQEALDVSPATLRRDLAELEAAGRLVRFHGGAAHPLHLRVEPTFEQRSRRAVDEKRAIAATAAALVGPQQTVFLDAGTSCLELGRLLMGRRDVTLVTNSVALAEAARAGSARVLCIGGELRPVTSALVGGLAQAWLEHLRADLAFVGASGLGEDGPSTTETSEAAVKQAMLARAGERYLLADAGKWGRASVVRFAPWSGFDAWVTSPEVSTTARRAVEALGPRVLTHRAPPEDTPEKPDKPAPDRNATQGRRR